MGPSHRNPEAVEKGETMPRLYLRPLIALTLVVALTASASAQVATAPKPLPTAPPASEGMAADRLARMHDRLDRFVADGEIAGAISLVLRQGKVVDVHTTGLRDREQKLPMTRDTIVRVYSMTKIVTSVAALILVEEGRLRLEDPIALYLPALKSPQVFTGGTATVPQLVPAARPITIRHLLTHTSGFAYGLAPSTVDDMYRTARLDQARTGDELVDKVARLPLIAQPGDRFYYGINTDLLGVIVEKVARQSLGAFLQTRVFDPLGMKDTGFSVPAASRSRLAKMYRREGTGPLTAVAHAVADTAAADLPYPDPEGRLLHSGGAGLFSTADDYARFAQMLLDGGTLDGVRILGRKTVHTMTSDQNARLPQATPAASGFGFGVSVRLDQGGGAMAGSVGEFGWSGAATTWVRMDPQEKTVAILLTQHLPGNQPGIYTVFSTMVNAAIQ
jgi:CubicO group peptidase (beta-lactamase class C family)